MQGTHMLGELWFKVELTVSFPCFSGDTLGKIPEANEAESQ